MSVQPGRKNFTIWAGATFHKTLTVKRNGALWDLTGYSSNLTIRDKPLSSTIYATLTVANGGIVLGGTAGTLQIIISATDTASYTWTTGAYDLLITAPGAGGETWPLLFGSFGVKGV